MSDWIANSTIFAAVLLNLFIILFYFTPVLELFNKLTNQITKLTKKIKKNINLRFRSYTKSEKIYLFGQALNNITINLTLILIIFISKSLTGNTAWVGVVRSVYFAMIGIFALFSGNLIKRFPVKSVLLRLLEAKAAVYFLIGTLYLLNILTFNLLLLLIGALGIIMSMSHLLDIDTCGGSKFFSSAIKIEEGLYYEKLFNYAVLLTIPLIAGFFIDKLDAKLGEGVGAAIIFLFLVILLLITVRLYRKFLNPYRENDRDLELTQDVTEKPNHSFNLQFFSSIFSSLKIIFSNKAIFLRATTSTFEQFLDDAIFTVVLPTFALDVLMTGATGLGMIIATMNLGGLVAAILLLKYKSKIQSRTGFYSFIFFLSCLSLFAFIPSMIFWGHPSIWLVVPCVFLIKFLYDPISSNMHALLQVEINADPKAKKDEENIYSLINLAEVLFVIGGNIFFVWIFLNSEPGSKLYAWFGVSAPMKILTLFLILLAFVNWIGMFVIKKQIFYSPLLNKEREEKCYQMLQKSLVALKKGNYIVENLSQNKSNKVPIIALLAEPSLDLLPLIEEGGRMSPGSAHLVFDSSWFIIERLPNHKNHLMLKKGLIFDLEGNAVIAEYKKPIQVDYFWNFHPIRTNKQESLKLESRLDTPMSSSVFLEQLLNDKAYSRFLFAQKRIDIPRSIGWLMPKHPLSLLVGEKGKRFSNFEMQKLPKEQSNLEALVKSAVEVFISKIGGRNVVLKTSGVAFKIGYSIRFFSPKQTNEIIKHILTLANDPLMLNDSSILLDECIEPPAIYLQLKEDKRSGNFCWIGNSKYPLHLMTPEEIKQAKTWEKKNWNLRVYVARTPWDGAITSGIVARAGTWEISNQLGNERPETANICIQIEYFLMILREKYNLLKSESDVWEFRKKIEDFGTEAFLALDEGVKNSKFSIKSPDQAQIDYLSFDIILERQDDKLVPKIVEIYTKDLFGQFPFDRFYEEKSGQLSKPINYLMLARAQRFLMRNKRLILVGSGYKQKKFFFDKANELGIKIILIDRPGSWAEELVSEYIPIDPEVSTGSVKWSLLLQSIEASIRKFGPIDGITTFWENNIVPAAKIAESFSLKYHSLKSAQISRNKYLSRKTMKAAGLKVPLFFMIHSEYELEISLNKINQIMNQTDISPFPMVLKPARGAAAEFVTKVYTLDETREIYKKISKEINESQDPIYGRGCELILEEYIDGNEWDVDLVLQGGSVLYTSITDNWPTVEPYFLDTGSSLPSRLLSQAGQQASIELSILAAHAFGITDGVIHVEGKYSDLKGAYLLEVNARPGGGYVVPWNLAVWGVDLAEMLFSTALGISTVVYKSEVPLTYLEGKFYSPIKGGKILKIRGIEEAMKMPACKRLDIYCKEGQEVKTPPAGYDRLFDLSVQGDSPQNAIKNLAEIEKLIHIDFE